LRRGDRGGRDLERRVHHRRGGRQDVEELGPARRRAHMQAGEERGGAVLALRLGPAAGDAGHQVLGLAEEDDHGRRVGGLADIEVEAAVRRGRGGVLDAGEAVSGARSASKV
jgi:hypothetical protein